MNLVEAISYMSENNCELKHVHTDEKDRWVFTCKVDDRIYGADAIDMLDAINLTKSYIEQTMVVVGEELAA